MRVDRRVVAAVSSLLAVASVAFAAAPELRRDADAFFLLTSRAARLQNLSLASACNVGVNCAQPGARDPRCGKLVLGDVRFAEGAQVAADRVFCSKPNGLLWQLFRNGGACSEASIAIVPPQTFTTPIIPQSCDQSCTPDLDALRTVCGFPAPFPLCDRTGPVVVRPGADCDGAVDTMPGNQRCDLAPGTYGTVSVRNGGRLALAAGTYAVCGLVVGRDAEVSALSTTVAIPATYDLRVGEGSRLGFTCGEVVVQADGAGAVSFGRGAHVAARVCAPERQLRLGSGTSLAGRFIGDTAVAGRNVGGECCCSSPCGD